MLLHDCWNSKCFVSCRFIGFTSYVNVAAGTRMNVGKASCLTVRLLECQVPSGSYM